MKAKTVNESIISPAVIDDFQKLTSELEKRRVPCIIQLSEYGGRHNIDVMLGWDYPDELADKVFDAMRATGVEAEVSADSSGGDVIKSRRIAGGPRRYVRGRRW